MHSRDGRIAGCEDKDDYKSSQLQVDVWKGRKGRQGGSDRGLWVMMMLRTGLEFEACD